MAMGWVFEGVEAGTSGCPGTGGYHLGVSDLRWEVGGEGVVGGQYQSGRDAVGLMFTRTGNWGRMPRR